ncbi:hypothetical protein KJ688_16390, partial [bacterium]|nr:hypothetical protein [bacterium]
SNGGGDEVGDLSLTTDSSLVLYAAAYDADSNYVKDTVVTWNQTGSLDGFPKTGSQIVFEPETAPVSGKITVSAGGLTPDTTGVISVGTGQIQKIVIMSGLGSAADTLKALQMTTDADTTLYAAAYDRYGNFVDNVSVTWSESGGTGIFSVGIGTSSTFSADNIGKGVLTASYMGITDKVYVDVLPGLLSYLIIRDGSNGGGDEVGDLSLTTDSSLVLYAAAYDADSNYVKDTVVTWNQTDNLDGFPKTGSQIVFEPWTAPSVGKIIASVDDLESDSTGTISVLMPPFIKYITNSLEPTIVTSGIDTIFSMDVCNIGNIGVTLNTQSFFTFYDSDGDSFITFLQSNTASSSIGDTVRLVFGNDTIPPGLSGGKYSSELHLFGVDSLGNSFSQIVLIEPNGIYNQVITIDAIDAKRESVTQGQDSLIVEMEITNHGLLPIFNIDTKLSFRKDLLSITTEYTQIRTDTFTQVAPGVSVTLSFLVYVQESATQGKITLNGFVSGFYNGVRIEDNDSNIKDTWTVNLKPSITYTENSIKPNKVTLGQTKIFSLSVNNSGGIGLTIDPRTILTVNNGSDTLIFPISSTVTSLNDGENDTLSFRSGTIPVDFQSGSYRPKLWIKGSDDNKCLFSDDIILTNDLVIQDPAILSTIDGTLSPDTVTQGQIVEFQVNLINTGGVNAILNMDSTYIKIIDNDIVEHKRTIDTTYTVSTGSTQKITFNSFTETIAAGVYQVKYFLSGKDANGFDFSFVDSSSANELCVQSPPNLTFISVDPNNVRTEGEYALTLSIKNIGDAGFLVTSSSYMTFIDSKQKKEYKAFLPQSSFMEGRGKNSDLDFKTVQ